MDTRLTRLPPARYVRRGLALALAALCSGAVPPLEAQRPALPRADSLLAREIYQQLIEIPSVSGSAATREAAEAIRSRLLGAGFAPEDIVLGGPEAGGNLAIRYRGSRDAPAILLMAHLDVVPANVEDWSFDPFVFREEDGYFYGRGTSDNTAGVSVLVTNLIRWKLADFVPTTDLVVILTADEETTSGGIMWLVNEQREWTGDIAYALNTDAGGGSLIDGRHVALYVQASEKMYLTFRVTATNPGGHSSVPRPDNAIYELSRALDRLSQAEWPAVLNEVSRAYFQRTAEVHPDPAVAADLLAAADIPADSAAIDRLSADARMNATMRTTCVATRLEAGHADNALPQSAQATVNCRVLPGGSADEAHEWLVAVLDDPDLEIRRVNEPVPSPPSPLGGEVLRVVEQLTESYWPGTTVIPSMSTGATDGLYVRNAGIPVYGVSAMFGDPSDIRAHGRDERVRAASFYDALQFWHEMVRRLAGR